MDGDQQPPPSAPPETGAPPAQRPYQQPQQLVQPAGITAPTPPSQRGGTNWLVVVLIACGAMLLVPPAVLVVITIYATAIWNQAKEDPIVQSAARLATSFEEMEDMTRAQIEKVAAYAPAKELGRDPSAFDGYYVMTDGTVSRKDAIGVAQSICLDIYRDVEDYKSFVLDDLLVVVDISGDAPDVAEGEVVRAYGMLLVLRVEDLWELPVIGSDLQQQYGEIEEMSETVVFLMAAYTEILASSTGDEATGKGTS